MLAEPEIRIVPCGPERAGEIHRLTQAAFQPHQNLDRPSGAGREVVGTVRSDLAAGGGALAEAGGRPVGALRWTIDRAGDFRVRRVAVEPELQRRGIGAALMTWAERKAQQRGCTAVSVGVRLALPDNLAFYRRLGYEPFGEHSHDGYDTPTWLALRKRV